MRVLFVLALGLCLVASSLASSHSEAPGTVSTPQADGTDLYVFRSYETGRQNFLVIIANFLPLQSPFAGPNYFSLSSEHVYDIYIDNTGDGFEDIVFRFIYGTRYGGPVGPTTIEVDNYCSPNVVYQQTTTNTGITLNIGGVQQQIPLKYAGQISAADQSNLNWFEEYQITYINGTRDTGFQQQITQYNSTNTVFTKPMDYVGTKTFPNYAAYAAPYVYNITIPGCAIPGRVFVGQRKESFQINLGPIFDLINFIPIPGFPGAIQPSKSNNALADRNIATFALELPINCTTGEGNGVIGVWQASLLLSHDSSGNHVVGKQVQRLGNPLVNELIIGLPDKGKYNRGIPADDENVTLSYMQFPTFPTIISNLFLGAVNEVLKVNLTTLAPNNYPREDLVLIFLQGLPGLNQLQPNNSDIAIAEYMRLNTSVPITAPINQSSLGVFGGDAAGFPNGRRPGDDVVDIGLDALMGAACWLNITCNKTNAPVGNVLFTDGVPCSVYDYDLQFPFLKLPLPGSGGSPTPTPTPLFPYTPIFTPTPVIICPPESSGFSFGWTVSLTVFVLLMPLLGFLFSSH